MESRVRTRIAPSPTGYLHIGTARTALFNKLFAEAQGGVFVLRVEDTDQERSRPEFEKQILDGLKWLGLNWDEGPDKEGEFGPYRQSERQSFYVDAIKKLLDSGAAYQEEGSEAVKLKVEAQTVEFTDEIREKVTINSDTWGGDFVIARNLSDPVFHLAVVVDDAAMGITHVIRGEDHLTNTARHILLQRALKVPTPIYAHLPLLLDKQRRKLSKRSGEVGLEAYREKGFLPEAIVNYLALLGWNPKDDRELFTLKELSSVFSLSGVQKGGAIFSEEKMIAVNKEYIRKLGTDELLEMTKPWLAKAGIEVDDKTYWQAALRCEQERVGTLAELPNALDFFRKDWKGEYPGEMLVWRKSNKEETLKIIKNLSQFLEDLSIEEYTQEGLEQALFNWIGENELGKGDVLWPMRVALTGKENSPGPFEVAAVLGKKITLNRLNQAWGRL
jgi:glutamyl-tRNA synthetase